MDPNCESTASAEFYCFHCMSVCIERSKASANTAPGERTCWELAVNAQRRDARCVYCTRCSNGNKLKGCCIGLHVTKPFLNLVSKRTVHSTDFILEMFSQFRSIKQSPQQQSTAVSPERKLPRHLFLTLCKFNVVHQPVTNSS